MRLISIAPLDELVAGPAEAKEYGRMQRSVGEALGSVKAVKPPPFSIDELYWTTRKLQAYEAWGEHGEWISVTGRRIGRAIYDRFAFGKTVSAAEAAEETKKRDAFRAALGDLIGDDGILVLPTVPCVRAAGGGLGRGEGGVSRAGDKAALLVGAVGLSADQPAAGNGRRRAVRHLAARAGGQRPHPDPAGA